MCYRSMVLLLFLWAYFIEYMHFAVRLPGAIRRDLVSSDSRGLEAIISGFPLKERASYVSEITARLSSNETWRISRLQFLDGVTSSCPAPGLVTALASFLPFTSAVYPWNPQALCTRIDAVGYGNMAHIMLHYKDIDVQTWVQADCAYWRIERYIENRCLSQRSWFVKCPSAGTRDDCRG